MKKLNLIIMTLVAVMALAACNDSVTYAELNDELWQHITEARAAGKLVLCMGAGTIDSWVRKQLQSSVA